MDIEAEIRRMLAAGDQKLKNKDFNGADQDYRNALDLAEKHQLSEHIQSAYEGRRSVQQLRLSAPGLNTTSLPPPQRNTAPLKAKLRETHSEERQLILLKQLISAGEQEFDGMSTQERYSQLLSSLSQRLLRQAKRIADEGAAIVKSLTTPVTEEARNGAVSQYDEAIQMLQGASITSSALTEEESSSAKMIVDELQRSDQVRQALKNYEELRRAVPAVSQAIMSEKQSSGGSNIRSGSIEPRPQISITDEAATRARELGQQADALLRRETRDNYKAALNLLTEALGFTGLDTASRLRILQRQADVEKRYEEFNIRFGELTTARQHDRVEQELILVQMLIQEGKSVGPDGENLVDRNGTLFTGLCTQLLRMAAERVSLADRLLLNGCNYLDLQSLQRADETLEEAIGLLRGKGMDSAKEEVTDLRRAVIGRLQADLSRYPDISNRLNEYTQRRADIDEMKLLIERCLPIYREAENAFNRGNYQQAYDQARALSEIVGVQMSSRQITLIVQRTKERRTADLSAELEITIERAQTALARNDIDSFTREAEQALRLDPTFSSNEIDKRRADIRKMLADLRRREQETSEQLKQVRQHIINGAIDEAEARCRTLLLAQPESREVHEVLNDILYRKVNRELQRIEGVVNGTNTNIEALKQYQELLPNLNGMVDEIDDPPLQRRLAQRCNEVRSSLERRSEALITAARRAQVWRESLDAAERYTRLEQFHDASRSLEIARQNSHSHDTRLGRIESELRDSWSEFLKRTLLQAIEQTPPQLDTALGLVQEIEQRGFTDHTSEALHRRARALQARSQGMSAMERGDFAAAIREFSNANLADDQETQRLLRDARQREINRLERNRQWKELVEQLEPLSPDSGGRPELLRRARGELALQTATTLLRDKRFDDCANRLDEFDLLQLPELSERSRRLRTELAQAKELFRRIEQQVDEARSRLRRFETNQDRAELRGAVELLDQALADPDLQPGDQQRELIQALRNDYQRRYQHAVTTERQRLLTQGNSQLKADQLAEALETFRELHDIVRGDDPDVRAGMDLVRQRLRELRTEMVAKIREQLNLGQGGQRGVQPITLRELIDRAQKLRAMMPDLIDTQLNSHLDNLQEAERLCLQADEALNNARQHWARLRVDATRSGTVTTGLKDGRRDVEGATERGVGIFAAKTYIHIELDRASTESLPARFSRDLEDLAEARRYQEEFLRLLEQEPLNLDVVINSFRQIKTVEDRLHETTIRLIERDRITSLSRPTSDDERYPRQGMSLRRVREQIEAIYRSESTLPDLKELRAVMERRYRWSELLLQLRQLDPDRSFAAGAVDTGSIRLEDLATWQQNFDQGMQQIGKAQEEERVARDAEGRKLLGIAAGAYDRSSRAYQEANRLLKDLAELTHEHQAIQKIRNSARDVRSQSSKSEEMATCATRCITLQAQAEALMAEAERSLEREKADEALSIDPTLGERVDALKRRIENDSTDERNPGVFIILALLMVIVIGLGIFFGPALWAWVREFLFPAMISVFAN